MKHSTHYEFDESKYWRFDRTYRPGLTERDSHEDVIVVIVAVLCFIVGYIVVTV